MRPGLFKSLYFSLRRPEDVQLLRFILALPHSQQNSILKAALQDTLPRYLRRHYPKIALLSPEAVEAAIKSAKRRGPRRSPAPHPWPTDETPRPPVLASPSGNDGHQLPSEPTPPVPPQPSETEHRQEAERKLDRLLRTLAK